MKNTGKIKLKVCGMRSPDNIRQIAMLTPDYMGFIFYKNSKRYVGDHFSVPHNFPHSIRRVGVFVNESTPEIARLANKHNLEFIQLHGDEPESQCRQLKQSGFKVIKAFSIDKGFDFEILNGFKNAVDFFLFDTKGVDYGGSGIAFDWDMLKMYDQEIPFFLSGGISVDNIESVLRLAGMNIHAVDVNSKVENSIAIKDPNLIVQLVERLAS